MSDGTPDPVSEIIKNQLYIGDERACRHHDHRFNCHVNVANNLDCKATHSFDLWTNTVDQEQVFNDAVTTLIALLQNKDNSVLIHCVGGIERSPTVSAAGLATLNITTFNTEIERIQQARPAVEPTPELRQLAVQFLSE